VAPARSDTASDTPSDATTLSTAFPRSATYTNALGQTIKSESSLSSTAVAVQTMSYDPATHIRTQIDPDGVRSLKCDGVRHRGCTGVPGILRSPRPCNPTFKCRWSITALDLDGDGTIRFSPTSSALADRITLTSSWLSTRVVDGSTTAVRHSRLDRVE